MSKDLWLADVERTERQFADEMIDRDEAAHDLKVLGFDPHEIATMLDAIESEKA